MANKVRLSVRAVEDIDSIVQFYQSQQLSDLASIKVYNAIIARIESLQDLTDRGRVVPEFWDEGIYKYRELIEGHFRIIYRKAGSDVLIIRVLDSRSLNDFQSI